MKPATNLKEFAEDMRRKGDVRHADLADEILMLIDLEEEVAEPYRILCGDLQHYAPRGLWENPERALEWLGDRSNLLKEVEEELEKAGRHRTGTDDVADLVRRLLEELPPREYDL